MIDSTVPPAVLAVLLAVADTVLAQAKSKKRRKRTRA